MNTTPMKLPGWITGKLIFIVLFLIPSPAPAQQLLAIDFQDFLIHSTYAINLQGTHLNFLNTAVISLSTSVAFSDSYTSLTGIFYGAVLILSLYHFLLFLVIRERKYYYLYFSLYLGGLALFQLTYYSPSANPDQSFWISNKFVGLYMGFALFWGSRFVVKLQGREENMVQLPKLMQGISIGACLLMIFSLVVNYTISIVVVIVLSLIFSVAASAMAYISWKYNRQLALFGLIGWGMLGAGVILFALSTIGVSAAIVSIYGLQIVFLIHITLLSLALADQINIMQLQKEQMRQEILKAEQSQRFKDQFLANTSHEIRTPMNAIIGFTRLLEQSVLASFQREYVRYIKDSASNLLVIINDILDFSKIESGKITFERVNIHLNKLCQSIIETLRFRINEKNLDVSYYIDEKIPDLVLGDPVRLNQILLNLLSNAIKFTEEGSVHLKIGLKHQTDSQITVLFEVKDTGIGIPEDKLSVIFESFSQASDHTTRKYGGTGLGLTIVKQLVELQGGSIQVKSKVNEGSSFSVSMTFDKGQIEAHTELRTSSTTGSIPANLTVLLIEDNPINQIVAVNTLQKWLSTIQIDVANNGKEGIAKLLSKNYHLLLVDIQMPEMDGYETTQYIRTQMPLPKNKVPIIALTAGALKADEERALEAGMNDYISKPFDAEVLFSKIRCLQIDKDIPILTGNKFEISNVERAGLGDPEFMVQLMDMFLKKTPEALHQMGKYVHAKDYKQVSFIAHRIKSVFVCMGLSHLQQELSEIETTALNDTNLNILSGKIAQLKKGCEEAYVQISLEREKLINNNS